MLIIDPAVHAALVIVFAWLINLLFGLLKINLGGDVINQLAELLVAYLLSLGGFAIYAKLVYGKVANFATTPHYHPPFS